ncbi:hypothetical protein [Mesorhizobium sp. M0578]|uniref:hypothetical protein n=1 Tax=unclassified Mesorhizobium TaxID=325217 RepID=UPI003336770D
MNTVLKTIAIVSTLAVAQPAFSFPTDLRPDRVPGSGVADGLVAALSGMGPG